MMSSERAERTLRARSLSRYHYHDRLAVVHVEMSPAGKLDVSVPQIVASYEVTRRWEAFVDIQSCGRSRLTAYERRVGLGTRSPTSSFGNRFRS
jgi:hypothetical protein